MRFERGSERPTDIRTMYGFSVRLAAQTASFREPSAHLYQRTYPMPPISAIAGIAGAACGLEFSEVWEYLRKNNIYVGVSGNGKGIAIDLWGYNKIVTPDSKEEKAGTEKMNLEKALRHDILNREFLAYPVFTLYYASEHRDSIYNIASAFKNPKYAISLGNSDDIAVIKSVSEVCEVGATETKSLKNTLIEGDFTKEIVFDWDALSSTSASKTLKAPAVANLIVDFKFKGLRRDPKAYKKFTFLFEEHLLRSPHQAYSFSDGDASLYCIGKE